MIDSENNATAVGPARQGPSYAAWLVVIVFSGLFFFFAFRNLDFLCLRTAEISTYTTSGFYSITDVIRYARNFDSENIAYGPVAWIFARLFGEDRVSVRVPALVFAALCIPLIFIITRRFFGSAAAVISAVFFAASPLLWTFAMDARSFSLFLFIYLFLIAGLLRYVSRPDSLTLAISVSFSVLSIMISRYGYFITAFAALAAYMQYRLAERKSDGAGEGFDLRGYLLPLAVVFFSMPFILRAVAGPGERMYGQETGAAMVSIYEWFAVMIVGGFGGFTSSNTGLALSLLPLAAAGFLWLRKSSPETFAVYAVWLAAVFAGIGIYGAGDSDIVQQTGFAENAGYIISAAAAALVPLCSYGIVSGFRKIFKRDASSIASVPQFIKLLVSGFLLVLLIVTSAVTTIKTLREVNTKQRENWSGVYHYLKGKISEGDRIAYFDYDADAIRHYFNSYENENRYTPVELKNEKELSKELLYNNHTWFISRQSKGVANDSDGVVEMLRRDRYHLLFEGVLANIDVIEVNGYYVDNKAVIRAGQETKSKEVILEIQRKRQTFTKAVECDKKPEGCVIELYLAERGKYSFTLDAEAVGNTGKNDIELCAPDYGFGEKDSDANEIYYNINQGTCIITISGNIIDGSELKLTVERTGRASETD